MGEFSVYLVRLDGSKTRSVRIGTADSMPDAVAFAEGLEALAEEHLAAVDRDRVEVRWKNTTETVSLRTIETGLMER